MFGSSGSTCTRCGGSKAQHNRMINVGFESPHAWTTQAVESKRENKEKLMKDKKRRKK